MDTKIQPQDIQRPFAYIEKFIAEKIHTVLPAAFFPKKVTSEVFFKKIGMCGFSAEECSHDHLSKFQYLGEILFAQPGNVSISQKITGLQKVYGVTKTHINNRRELRKEFNAMPIGDVVDFEEIEPLFVFYKQSPDALFGDKCTKKFIEKCSLVRKYCLLLELMWYQKSHESILNNDDAVPV